MLKINEEFLENHQGIWFSKKDKIKSYPDEGHDFCFQIEDNSYWFQHRNKCIISIINHFKPKDNTIVEVGGGNGFVSNGLQNAGYDVFMVEPGINGLKNAQKRGVSNLICANLEDAGFSDNSIPAIGFFDVLEHIEDDDAFLKTVYSLLADKGKVFLTVPAFNFLWASNDIHAGHFRRYTLPGITQILKSHGFTIDYASYMFKALIAPIFLFRTLPSKLGFSGKKHDSEKSMKQLSQDKGLAFNIINLSLEKEFEKIKRLEAIPFGSSVIVAATKKKKQ